EAPILSPNEAAVDASNGNEQIETVVDDLNKETCVASGDGTENVETGSQDVEKEEDVCEEQLESDERVLEEIQDKQMEEEQAADVISGDANIEEKNEDSVTSDAIEKEDTCVASGGIKERSVSKKKLLVLDLNGLLADIVSSPGDYVPDTYIQSRALFKRPFCEDFLKFCFDKFEVGIWSTKKQKNVERITEFLLGDMKSKLLFCWGMSYCSTTTVWEKDVVFKDLNKLWEEHEPNLPWKAGDYNKTNTVLVDHSPCKALLNPEYSLTHTSIRTRQTHP
ncbi:hypothetical protein EUTSA_v10028320mg, partial [Eutrema salsugineum]